MKLLLYCFLLVIFLASCLPVDKRYPIWIENTTTKGVYFHVNNYLDTLLPQTDQYVVLIHAKDRISIDSDEPWEEVFLSKYPKDTLQIFYINVDTINKYDWNIIRLRYLIKERRTFSQSDLKNINWTITYP